MGRQDGGSQEPGSWRWWGPRAGAQMRASTYERDSVRWKRCRRPRNMTKELGGKERAATSQRGPSKAPPAGHWQRKPPSGPLAQVPPLRQTPGTQRPASVSSSQSSPRGSSRRQRRGQTTPRPRLQRAPPLRRPRSPGESQEDAKVPLAVGMPLLYQTLPSLAFRPCPSPGSRPFLFLCPVKLLDACSVVSDSATPWTVA